MNVLKDGERVDDLGFDSLKIIQSVNYPRFSSDAVLIADFSRVGKGDKVLDLGTGTGIIPILMHSRYSCSVTGIEIDPYLADMASRSVALNSLTDKIKIINGDFTVKMPELAGAFDAVVSNPPYFKSDNPRCPDPSRDMHRAESTCDLKGVVTAAAYYVKSGGKFFLCYPAERLAELIFELKSRRLEPKVLRLVKSTPKKPAYLALIEAKKDAKEGIIIRDTLTVFDEDGRESAEARVIYRRDG